MVDCRQKVANKSVFLCVGGDVFGIWLSLERILLCDCHSFPVRLVKDHLLVGVIHPVTALLLYPILSKHGPMLVQCWAGVADWDPQVH